jgi:hypothetical protein
MNRAKQLETEMKRVDAFQLALIEETKVIY